MTVDKVELRRLAEECGKHGDNWYESRNMAAFPEFQEDQDFVIAANPSTVLALLDECEKAEAERDAAFAELSALKAQLADLQRIAGGDDFHSMLRNVEGMRMNSERYCGVRRVANSQGYSDQEFDEQTDARISKFDAAIAHAKENGNE